MPQSHNDEQDIELESDLVSIIRIKGNKSLYKSRKVYQKLKAFKNSFE